MKYWLSKQLCCKQCGCSVHQTIEYNINNTNKNVYFPIDSAKERSFFFSETFSVVHNVLRFTSNSKATISVLPVKKKVAVVTPWPRISPAKTNAVPPVVIRYRCNANRTCLRPSWLVYVASGLFLSGTAGVGRSSIEVHEQHLFLVSCFSL